MQALELEFGGEGKRAKPVFRQVIKRMRSVGARHLPNKYKVIRQAWFDPNSKRWKRWPGNIDKVGKAEVRKYQGFQKRLGYG
jgi:hypothetical protein